MNWPKLALYALAALVLLWAGSEIRAYFEKPIRSEIVARNNALARDSAGWAEQRAFNATAFRKISFDLDAKSKDLKRLKARVTDLKADSSAFTGRVTALLAAEAAMRDTLDVLARITRSEGSQRLVVRDSAVYPRGRTDLSGELVWESGADTARGSFEVSMATELGVDWQRGEDLVSTCTVTAGHPKLTITDIECAVLPDPIEQETRRSLTKEFLASLTNPLSWLERGLFFLGGYAVGR